MQTKSKRKAVTESLIVSFDFRTDEDGVESALCLVGTKPITGSSAQKVINAFTGQKAVDIYHQLTDVPNNVVADKKE